LEIHLLRETNESVTKRKRGTKINQLPNLRKIRERPRIDKRESLPVKERKKSWELLVLWPLKFDFLKYKSNLNFSENIL
jgi:hypothetical protein